MTASFVLLQLSDPHVGADWDGADARAMLANAVEAARDACPSPDAVLLTGDLAEHAEASEYEDVRRLVRALGAPVYVVAGNHDDRATMRCAFDLPGTGDEPVQYAADLGPLRLVVLDTSRPGHVDGELDERRMAWLDETLAAFRTPTIVAMHHPPVPTGLPAFDRIGLSDADRDAVGSIVSQHAHVRRVVTGHVHRAITSSLGICAVTIAPSTYLQSRLDLRTDELAFGDDPSGFVVHALVGDDIASHAVFLR